jgi:hypothetical protein
VTRPRAMIGSLTRRLRRLRPGANDSRVPRPARSGDRVGSVQAKLEVFLIALGDGRADLRFLETAAPSSGDPDRRVRELARREADGEREPFAHSTSWRSERAVLVLTYLVVVDALRSPDTERVDLRELSRQARLPNETDGPLRGEVLWHGLRHLALLVRERPDFYARRLPPRALEALAALPPSAAGKLESPARER